MIINNKNKKNKLDEFINILKINNVEKLEIWFKNNKIAVTQNECEKLISNKDSLIFKAFYINKILNFK